MDGLDAHKLTWAALLGGWLKFARSAVALPSDAPGRAMKAAVPDIIALQATACALRELDQLPPEERALGIDRAAVLIERHGNRLRELFPDGLLSGLSELIDDANAALNAATPNRD